MPAKNDASASASLSSCSAVRVICLLFTSWAQSNALSSIVSSTNASAAMGLVCCASSSPATCNANRKLQPFLFQGTFLSDPHIHIEDHAVHCRVANMATAIFIDRVVRQVKSWTGRRRYQENAACMRRWFVITVSVKCARQG